MLKPNKIDRYIVGKYLGTFFFAITLLMFITVVFDLSEKMDEFMENEAPTRLIITDYYLNFIPYFAVLFTPLFTFISVIFFTSRMAYNTEIIAILSSGISFRRMLVPYLISGLIIMILNIYLVSYIIPKANETRFEFEERYYHNTPISFRAKNVHRQLEPGVVVYFESYSTYNNFARKFSIENFEDGFLKSKLLAESARWDSTIDKWNVKNYVIRDFEDNSSTVRYGKELDTTLAMSPEDFNKRTNSVEALNRPELNQFIKRQRLQGISNIEYLLIEKHKRFAFPFSTLILTIIGVSVSSRKVRGGIGMHIGIGLLVAFSYILFQQFATQFAIGGNVPAVVAVWIPNIIFGGIAAVLYRMAPK